MKRRLLYLVILVIATGLFYGGAKWQGKQGQTLMVPQRVIRDSDGNPKTRPSIEWLNDKEFALYKGCGTECETVYLFNINNFQRKFYYGVEHRWSPNKQYVLAYHYAIQPGITVGDRLGNVLFAIRRSYSPDSGAYSRHEASWSPDSLKLALIIQKEHGAGLELMVFDVEHKFNLIKQRDLESNIFTHLEWKDERTVSYEVDGEVRMVTL